MIEAILFRDENGQESSYVLIHREVLDGHDLVGLVPANWFEDLGGMGVDSDPADVPVKVAEVLGDAYIPVREQGLLATFSRQLWAEMGRRGAVTAGEVP